MTVMGTSEPGHQIAGFTEPSALLSQGSVSALMGIDLHQKVGGQNQG